MRLNFTELEINKKLEYSIIAVLLLFITKTVIVITHSVFLSVLLFSSFIGSSYFISLYFNDLIKKNSKSPLYIIKYIALFSVSSTILFLSFFSLIGFFDSNRGFVFNILTNVIFVLLIIAATYILSGIRFLFLLRQKKTPVKFFNAMITFLILTGISQILSDAYSELDFISKSFLIMSIFFICLNSIKVAWIAYLTKREKLYLLFGSVALCILFIVNMTAILNNDSYFGLINSYSPGLPSILILIMLYGAIYFGVVFFTTLFHLPTAEAYDRKAQELSSLLDLSNLLTSVFDFKDLAERITEITIKVCNASSVWLVTEDEGEYKLVSIRNVGYNIAEKIMSTVVNDEMIAFKKNHLYSKADLDLIFSNNQIGINNVVVVPLKFREELNGYLFAAKNDDVAFDDDELKTITTYADYAAITLENAKLIKESFEKERMEKELDVAREIQHKIIPSKLPVYKNLDISALFVPAFEVGGDYYDFFELDENRLAFVIADVSGKGISAAFIMAEVKGVFESLSRMIDSPKDLLIKANDVLKKSMDKKNFVTAIYGIFDFNKGYLKFARCGHPPLMHFGENGMNKLKPNGLGLGINFTAIFADNLIEEIIPLRENDLFVVYTDGITESKNKKLEDFGESRLENEIIRNFSDSTDDIANKIMSAISCYSVDYSQHDDITLVIFKIKNKRLE